MAVRPTVAAAVVACVLGLAAASFAGKTTVDPNTVKTAPPVKAPDKRLEQKVTYESLDKRLHFVLDDLTAKTGVTIRCGDGKDDWQVRDLPLVVCARGLPLGKLLRAIADSTHLLLSSYDIDGVRSYRIWRDKARKQQLDDYFARVKERWQARAEWEWDTWVQLGRSQDLEAAAAQFGKDHKDNSDFDPALSTEFAKIMGLLGPEVRQKAFADEEVRLKIKDQSRALATAISAFYRDSWEAGQRLEREERRLLAQQNPDIYKQVYPNGEPEEKAFSSSAAQEAQLVIRVYKGEGLSLTQRFEGPAGETDARISCPPELAKKCLKDWPGQPKRPDAPETAYGKSFVEPDWESPLMQAKPKMEKPKDNRILTFADVMGLISKAAGVSIVCEDFLSHKKLLGSRLNDLYPGINLGSAIRNMGLGSMPWRIDEQQKLVIGSSAEWCKRHTRLVPESFILHLREKLNGDGADLDDVVSVRRLTDGQYDDWVRSCEMEAVGWVAQEDAAPFWRLYDSLSPEDKAAAKSEAGLKLSKFDPGALAAVFKEAAGKQDPRLAIGRAVHSNPDLERRIYDEVQSSHPEWFSGAPEGRRPANSEQLIAELVAKFPELNASTIPTDTVTIAATVLRIREQVLSPYIKVYTAKEGSLSCHTEQRPDGFVKRRYHMTLEADGKSLRIDGPGLDFPVYSRQRETKLWEEKQKAAKQSAPKGEK